MNEKLEQEMYSTEKENKLPYSLGSSIKEVFSDFISLTRVVLAGEGVFML